METMPSRDATYDTAGTGGCIRPRALVTLTTDAEQSTPGDKLHHYAGASAPA